MMAFFLTSFASSRLFYLYFDVDPDNVDEEAICNQIAAKEAALGELKASVAEQSDALVVC